MMQLEIIAQKSDLTKSTTPILFVHGMWDSAKSWDEHFLPYFAQHGYSSYALSLRGHGLSEGKDRLRWTSLSDYVDDVAQVVNQLGALPVLVGHSMGAVIVQKYLEVNHLPAAVLLASPPPQGMIAATLMVARRYPLSFLKANLTLSLYPLIENPERFKELLFSNSIPDEELALYFSRMQDESYRAYLDMLLLNLPKPERIKTKMLVLGGANDPTVTPDRVKSTAKALGACEHIISNMSHYMMLEPTWKSAANQIIDWLRECNL